MGSPIPTRFAAKIKWDEETSLNRKATLMHCMGGLHYIRLESVFAAVGTTPEARIFPGSFSKLKFLKRHRLRVE